VGITEVLTHIGTIYRVYARLKRFLSAERPDLLVLIDFPDFNILLGKAAKKLGIPVLYYISPQVWAWRKGRVRTIAKLVKTMIVVFPFEVDIYKNAGVDVRFVGHPLIDVVRSAYTREEARRQLGLDPARRTVAILPGSRRKEIANLLPDMLGAARVLRERFPELQFILPVAPTLEPGLLRVHVDAVNVPVRLVEGRVYDVLRASDAAIITSGTATLETGLMAVPMVIVYRMSGASYHLVKLIADAKYIGLVNIIANRQVVPELIQGAVTPENIADAVAAMLNEPASYRKMVDELLNLRTYLGEAGASARTASVLFELLEKTTL
jgi:lipid-A-disaccharide synthase